MNLETVYDRLTRIDIGENVEKITLNEDEYGSVFIKIYGYENSYAQKFANNQGIDFVVKNNE